MSVEKTGLSSYDHQKRQKNTWPVQLMLSRYARGVYNILTNLHDHVGSRIHMDIQN